jgi:hypothetical protein
MEWFWNIVKKSRAGNPTLGEYTFQNSNFSYELVICFCGLINEVIDTVLRKKVFRSIDILMRR